jgi:hypothetical protein
MHKSTNLQLEYRICSALGPRKRINFRADKCFQGFFKVVVLLTNSILVWSTPVWLLPLEHLECPETLCASKVWMPMPSISLEIVSPAPSNICFYLAQQAPHIILSWQIWWLLPLVMTVEWFVFVELTD